VGQESNLHPAVLETQSGVSGGVGRHRHMPICPIISVVFCRRLSQCVAGHWGRYWGSRCSAGALLPDLSVRSAAVHTWGMAWSGGYSSPNLRSVRPM